MQKYLIVGFTALRCVAADLSLPEAAKLALSNNPAITAARHLEKGAEARIRQVESARLPHVQWQENIQGGNNPVYVFSSLLTQRQFGANNFAIPALVRPGPLQNFQTQLNVDQSVYDFGRTRALRREADAGRELTVEERRRQELDILTQTARAYYGTLLAEAATKTAERSLQSLLATQERAGALRNAQMATDADVFSIDVQVATAREEIIRRQQQAEVARASLNHAIGQPLETAYSLTTQLVALAPAEATPVSPARPEVRMSALQEDLAKARMSHASAMLLPEVGLRFQLEADRQNFVNKGGVNWIAMGTFRWNLFDGGNARQLRAETGHAVAAAAAQSRSVRSAVHLQVLQADAAIRAATARESVTEAAINQANESLRILRNRYGVGLATISEVLRAEAALLEAETRRLSALHDQRVARIEREAAAGNLTGDSNVLR